MTAHVRREEDAGILTVTFTRDAKLNAIDGEMLDALREASRELGDREDLRVMVITAEGRYFTAGIDMTDARPEETTSGVAIRRNYRRLHLLVDEMEAIEKPIILAAQGPCLGFGVELAVSCDFRLASEHASFGLPEIANMAVIPGSGGISRLTRLLGPHWARWLAMAGQQVDASQAVAIGLVHQVFPGQTFAADVHAFARQLATASSEALGLAKLAIDAAANCDRTTARDIDRVANSLLLLSGEYGRAMERFAEAKRARSGETATGA